MFVLYYIVDSNMSRMLVLYYIVDIVSTETHTQWYHLTYAINYEPTFLRSLGLER